MGTLLIHAPNVHGGGGGVLLRLLSTCRYSVAQRLVVADRRFVVPETLPDGVRIEPVEPSVVCRLRAERRLAGVARRDDLVLCLGNLPPLFRLSCRVVLFLQNRYLVEDLDLSGFSLRSRLRIAVERRWFRACIRHVDTVVVQTRSMKELLLSRGIVDEAAVRVMPFSEGASGPDRQGSVPEGAAADGDARPFLYVASGEPHKNHRRLIEAWARLAADGLFPPLLLTLDEAGCPDLCSWVDEQAQRHGLRIVRRGGLSHETILGLYADARALIYPSLAESLGLPLVEARRAGLAIIAPERDYVRDVAEPVQTFDPDSAVSIARAVRRFLECPEPLVRVRSPEEFLTTLWTECR